jgi:YaiO family outer membrane protein
MRGTCQGVSIAAFCLALLSGSCAVLAQNPSPDWQSTIRELVRDHRLHDALAITEERLAREPSDLEARGWHARLLAWTGDWPEAEREYREVLNRVPGDAEILTGLADVLIWQQKGEEALAVLDRALAISPGQPGILLRRARLLRERGQNRAARADYLDLLQQDPQSREARTGLAALKGPRRHDLRVGVDVDTFNYTDSAQAQSLSLISRWTEHWSTAFGTNTYQRFGENAAKFTASTGFRFTKSDWVNLGGAVARDERVIPKGEAFFEVGHGFRFHGSVIRGLEASYQQRWLWYEGAHVLTLSLSQIYYLPRDWTWALTVTGARSGFWGTRVDWVPSGSSRLGFPVFRRLSGNISFGVGSENFAQVDQIGRFAARTYGAGLKYRFAENQDISGYFAWQDRSQDRTQTSFGISYGIRF